MQEPQEIKNLITHPRGIASLLTTVAWAIGVQDVSYGQPPVEEDKIYWTEVDADAEWGSTIRRANVDGSEVETLITGLQDPFELALDLFEHKMYWTDL